MARNRITPAAAVRLGLAAALAGLALATTLAACGRGERDTGAATAPAAKEADAEILNAILARQLGVVAAYPQAMSALDARTLPLLRRFRAQEGEHADGIVKALRGLNEEAEARAEAIAAGPLRTRGDRLRFAYEMESATIDAELSAIARLESPSARTLLAATVANQAQHLTVLRKLLGARPLQTAPEAFETGETPAP